MELLQHLSDSLQFFSDGLQEFPVVSVGSAFNQSQFRLQILLPFEISDLPFRSCNGKSLLVEEFLELDVAVRIPRRFHANG